MKVLLPVSGAKRRPRRGCRRARDPSAAPASGRTVVLMRTSCSRPRLGLKASRRMAQLLLLSACLFAGVFRGTSRVPDHMPQLRVSRAHLLLDDVEVCGQRGKLLPDPVPKRDASLFECLERRGSMTVICAGHLKRTGGDIRVRIAGHQDAHPWTSRWSK